MLIWIACAKQTCSYLIHYREIKSFKVTIKTIKTNMRAEQKRKAKIRKTNAKTAKLPYSMNKPSKMQKVVTFKVAQ